MKDLLVKKNPFKNNCKSSNCPPCKTAVDNKPSDCREQNITYQGICINCEENGVDKIYDGETARNLNIRSNEHMNGFKNKNETNFIYKHVKSDHPDHEEVRFRWKVTGKFTKPMQRQLFEAIKIDKKKDDENLNSKSEYNGHSIRRLTIEREKTFNCNKCSYKFKTNNEMISHKNYMNYSLT